MKKPRMGGSGASWFLLGERGDGREPITVTATYAFDAPRTTPASITICPQVLGKAEFWLREPS
jgi:hypothetical protein